MLVKNKLYSFYYKNMLLNAATQKIILYLKNNFISLLFLLIALLLLGSFYLQYQNQKSNQLYNIAYNLKYDLDKLSKKFDLFCEETDLLKRLTNNQYTNADLQKSTQENYTFLIYNSEKLVFWNNNDISLPIEKMRELTYDVSWLKLPSGYFQAIKRSLILEFQNNTSQSYTIVALQLIKNNFEIQNKYIQNNTNTALRLPPLVEITNKEEDIVTTETETPQYYPISQKGTTFYLYYTPQQSYNTNNYNTTYSNTTVITLQALALILLAILCILVSLRLCNRKYYLQGFSFLVLSFITLRLIGFYVPLPFGLHQLPMFEYLPPENLTPISPSLPNVETVQPENIPPPTFFQTLVQYNNPMSYSLGDMIISLILITILGIFFYHKLPHHRVAALFNVHKGNFQRLKAAVIMQAAILSLGILIWWVLKLLLYNFKVSFEIESTNYFAAKNMVALSCIVLLFLNFCLSIRKISYISTYFNFKNTEYYKAFAIILLPFISVIIAKLLPIQVLFVLLIFPSLWLLKKYVGYKLHAPLDSRYMLSWIFGFALLSSLIIHSYTNLQKQKAKKAFAEELALEKDLITEFLFADAANRILEDDIISNYYDIPLLPEYNIKERILQRYLSGYFDRYSIKIYCFNLDGDLTNESGENIQLTSYQSRINKRGYITKNSYLYLIDNPSTGGYNYLAKLPIFSSRPSAELTGGLVGYMVIEMESKANPKTNIYPELIIEDQFRQPAQVADYSYATYKNAVAINQSGNYPYSTTIDSAFVFPINENQNKNQHYITKNGYTHFIFQPNESKTIIVSSINNTVSSFLSIFSQIFFLVLSAVFITIIFINIANINIIQELKINFLLYASLRQRINTIIIVLLFGSFLIIGVATLAYFYQRSTNKHTESLVVKQNEVLIALSNTLRKNWESKADTLNAMDNRNFLAHTARTLSEIHAMDINLYTADGQMIASSQPVIFEKQIMSNLMNPKAYFQMKINGLGQFLQNENIGTLTYLAAYKPIKNERAEVIGFLNLPYFATEKDLRTELSGFMITLINVYVLLMLLAVSIAIAVANSITQPLQMISQKLSEFRLGQKNERLTWQYNDEVGLLVEQYNNTIGELEKSVKMLAQSERQSAWQEMARQVAHEIKNPLTPMKLSIQHLQRAVRDNAPNLKERTERVSLTLIEQIDTLAGIASSFSEFARMPKSIDEIFDMKDVINNVANLYAPSENNQVIVHTHVTPNQNYLVFADRNQMLRVFNNLVKNAIQAIPETREGTVNIKIDLNTSQTPTMVQISVQDNGCGISEEQLEKIFVPNFTTKSSGTGLGLSISKAIVEMAKGNIWFETTENKGTTFFVELPLVS